MSDRSSEYRDSRWQQKRLEIMERDGWKCRSCGKGGEGVTLNVHHAYYVKGRKPWEYAANMLVTYCEKCHESRHRMVNDVLFSIAGMTMHEISGLWALLSIIGATDWLAGVDPAYSIDSADFEAVLQIHSRLYREMEEKSAGDYP